MVRGQLGQPGHQLLNTDLLLGQGAPTRLPAQGAHQARLLQVILQPRPRVVLDVKRRQLWMPRESARSSGGSEGRSEENGLMLLSLHIPYIDKSGQTWRTFVVRFPEGD